MEVSIVSHRRVTSSLAKGQSKEPGRKRKGENAKQKVFTLIIL